MTAQPEYKQFTSSQTSIPKTAGLTRPNVIEHYWGYDISPNEQVFDLVVMLRAVAGVIGVACLMGSVGIWFIPKSAFSGDPAIVKALGAILMTCIAAITLRFVARGTHLRVQIDRSTGEVREVVDGVFGSDVVLAQHGMDAIEGVEIMPSSFDPAYGQVQIDIKGKGPIPAGDGAIVALRGLRDRISSDVGLDKGGAPREAVWVGSVAL